MQGSIDVVLMTWPNHPARLVYLQNTLTALRNQLTASRHGINWMCSAESEHDAASTWHGDELGALCDREGLQLHWHLGPASLGAGMNASIRASQSDVMLLVQDDYLLLEPLDLSPGVDALRECAEVDMIRYRYFVCPPHSTQFSGELKGFRRVNINGPWPYGDDPHLRHRRMIERYGWYTEGIGHGAEGDMVGRLVRGRACILAADRLYFEHVGFVSAVPSAKESAGRAIRR